VDHLNPAGLVIELMINVIIIRLVQLSEPHIIAQKSIINPLIRFGPDPISRIAFGLSKSGDFMEMTFLVRSTIHAAVLALVADAGLSPSDLVDAVIMGEPMMHHVMLGLDPSALGQAPYTPCVSDALDLEARELGFSFAPGALVHCLPLIGGHVGSDTLAAAFYAGLDDANRTSLLIDLGTTIKIVLVSKGRMVVAAPPAGSVLDGVLLEAGRHVVPGAIETIRIDPQTFEPRFKVIGSPYWSDEAEFARSIETMDLGGFCSAGLVDALAELRLAGLMGRDGSLDPAKAEATPRIREEYRSATYLVRESEPRIALTQHDIRALQMAKGAVQASARILMKRLDVTALDRVVLTSSSNVTIDPLRAAIIGLFPDCDPEAVEFLPNAAIEGASAALSSLSVREAMADRARKAEMIETVLDPDFQSQHIACTGFPHRSEAFPKLARCVGLEDPSALARGRREGRRLRV
jgi:uncharacterized 2Fe-2S/4Fe-4S cluster protein (DUF4445 family)